MSNLLEKASILTTPTAYNDGKLLSVKPEQPYSDEITVNGNFDTDSDWSKGAGWTISNGEAIHTGGGSYISQTGTTIGKSYRVVIEVTQASGSGFPQIYMGGLTTAMTSVGTYTFDIVATSTSIKVRGLNDCKITSISVKEATHGDFDFTRNSSATRVASNGLIEDVQILSGNLVTNGDFSQEGAELVTNGDFSQEGSELVTNGDFATDSDWNRVGSNGWSIDTETNTLNFSNASSYVFQGISTVSGKSYKVTLDIELDSGTIVAKSFSAQDVLTVTSTGRQTLTGYFKEADSNANFGFVASGASTSGKIYSISVKEVGQDWNLGSGFSIGENKLIGINANSSTYQGVGIQANKTYKIQFTVLDYVSGNVRPLLNGAPNVDGTNVSANGIYTQYLTSTSNSNGNFSIRCENNFNGSIDNVSVKEVGQDWTLGSFTSIGNNIANIINSTGQLSLQQNIGVSQKTIKLTYTISNYAAGAIRPQYGAVNGLNRSANGTYTEIITGANVSSNLSFFSITASTTLSITNISVIEITDDTNLPRIDYDGFSYQDALGSELVTNGDFENGENDWDFGGDWELVNGTAEIQSSTNSFLIQSNVFDLSVKTYKLQYEVVTTNGSNFKLGGGNSAFGTITIDSATIGTKTAYLTTNGTKRNLQFNQNAFRGSIDNVSVKEYLGQEVVPDSGVGHILLEPQSTNLIPYSQDFSTYSAYTGASIEQNYSISPEGVQNSTKLNLSANAFSRIELIISGSFASQTHTVSVWARCASNTEEFRLKCTNRGYVDYYSENKTVTTQWQRFSFSATFGSSAGDIGAAISNSTDAQERSIEIFGFQLEANKSFPTSYIPTNGSTVTRLGETLNNSGSSDLINSTEGVLYAEISALANDNSTRVIVISDGTNANRVFIGYWTASNEIRALVKSGNVTQVFQGSTSYDILDLNKIAFKFKENDFALWINGVEVFTDTSGITFPIGTLSQLDFDSNGSAYFYGKVKCVAVYKEALTDEELQELTT